MAQRPPLRLSKVVSRTFGPGSRYRPELVEFLTDVATLYGADWGDQRVADADRNTFTEMVRAVLGELASPDEPFDLALVAHSTPDAEPGWPGCALTSGLPGEPAACGISDQGVGAPFTALRLASAYARVDGARRVVVVALDQRTIVVDSAAPPGSTPDTDGLVALVLDPDGSLGNLSVRQLTTVAGADLDAAMASALSDDAAPGVPATVVVGGALAERWSAPPGVEVVRARPGLPCSGLWAAFAAQVEQWNADGRQVLLADYEPAGGELNVCRADVFAHVPGAIR
jgi:hypothetical protein